MTTHRPCLDALTEAMALPSLAAVLRNPHRIVVVPDQALATVPSGQEAQGPPRHNRRQQGRIQDYGERRAG